MTLESVRRLPPDVMSMLKGPPRTCAPPPRGQFRDQVQISQLLAKVSSPRDEVQRRPSGPRARRAPRASGGRRLSGVEADLPARGHARRVHLVRKEGRDVSS